MIAAQYVEAATTSASEASPGQSKYTCICCRVKFETVELQRGHFKSEWHLYNLKRKVCSLEPIELEHFNQIQAAVRPRERDDDEASLADLHLRLVEVPNKPEDKNGISHEMETDDYDEGEDDWEMIGSDGQEDNDAEYGEEEILKLLADAVDCDTCLFCNKKNSSVNKNVNHMYDFHGFFIPEEKYLIDREGLLEYLGFKVGAGATCLWCNKQFTTTHGARLHMMYKDHCKIFYDHEKAIGEFREFYDYSNQETFEMKPIDQLVVLKRSRSSRGVDDRQLISDSDNNQLDVKIAKKLAKEEALRAKNFKKFDSYRSKVILSTHLTNNRTTRDRIRLQNPI